MGQLTYREAVEELFLLPTKTKKNPFAQTQAFYRQLGEPGSRFPIIHVAGTNGKGSVCAYINSILSVAGYRVGMFTSPHLVDVRERLVLQNGRIGEETFARLFCVLQKRLEEYAQGAYRPSFFETLFFVFMLWMEEEEPDAVLLEAGMGGRLDVTNVVRRPAVTAITGIGLDHCAYLGATREAIAREKAGIFKEGVLAVCWQTGDGVERVFRDRARELSVPLRAVSKKEVKLSKIKKNYIDFFLKSAYDRYIEVHLETSAIYQTENAALAVAALGQAKRFFNISEEQIKQGLSQMRWEARMEEVRPDVYLDGAHNPDGIRAFLQSVERDGFLGERWLLFGACADKAVGEMAALLQGAGLFTRSFGVLLLDARGLSKPELERLFMGERAGFGGVFADAGEAVTSLLSAKGEDVRLYIVGSLYLAGEVKRKLSLPGDDFLYAEDCHD